MVSQKKTLADLLHIANLMIHNALSNEGIKLALLAYGYDETLLLIGKALCEEVEKLTSAQWVAFGEKMKATTQFNQLWKEADRQYMTALKVARLFLKDLEKARQATMLFGIRKQSFNGWQEQAVSFYANILGESQFMEIMARYGYPKDRLQREYDLIHQVIEKKLDQKKRWGDLQQATRIRDQKAAELASYISNLRAIAKLALAEDPQMLESLGILARSTPRKHQIPTNK